MPLEDLLPALIAKTYHSEVDDDYPPYPYVILAEGSEALVDEALTRRVEGGEREVFITVVDTTAHNVNIARRAVRDSLNPTGLGVHIEGGYLKLRPELCSPIKIDKDNGQDRKGRYPYFAVDVYTLGR